MNQNATLLEDNPETEKLPARDSSKKKRRVPGTFLRAGRRVGESVIKLKTIVATVVAGAVIISLGVVGWQLHVKSGDLDDLHMDMAAQAHAEQVALDYATGAAQMDFHDLASWHGRLTKGTSPELTNRLSQAGTSMEQIITPLQWVSTASPVAAKVSSEANGVYAVDCFINVLTKNSQAPDGIQSTATYKLTLDSRHNWLITDIGGIDSALSGKAPK
jgi:Mce-associated membrane protein